MLALKLLLVPAFLLALSLAGRRWGPSVAGWLAGLPAVGGPILFFLAYEHGTAFAATAASAALAAVFPTLCFCVTYAHAAQRLAWPLAYLCAFAAWLAGVFAMAQLPITPLLALVIALGTLLIAPRLFPRAAVKLSNVITAPEIACRMLAGAALTIGVTAAWACSRTRAMAAGRRPRCCAPWRPASIPSPRSASCWLCWSSVQA